MAKPGRPKIKFDLTEIRKLAALFCTDEEYASFFDCSVDTWARRKLQPDIADTIKLGQGSGKLSLRRSLFLMTSDPTVPAPQRLTACIYLSKQHLGYSDKHDWAGSISTEPIIHKVEYNANSLGQILAVLTDCGAIEASAKKAGASGNA